ncbi:polysaccharide biosynthesis tyrosine autokinase [Sulfitobacter sp. S0837]|uniref:polysaccharide biosynthesis tyrosine autokinase n=1 Tax=Sulfitobacter maritimus TaxID=2741719 RepID=UPI0015822807|nr:polysaccharide biosynthesis tyrosine autokinase [Sulfitobacter maritimus]NUH66507.1 polysaccharide biosynthesis tyrosine autokinase [Sulfitobacter maritimus]
MEISRTIGRDPGHQVPSTAASADENVTDLGALFSTLWREKWLIGLGVLVALLIGGYYAYIVATPLYRSTAVVILKTKQDQIVDLQSVVGGLSGDTSEVNSEVEVLRARSLMREVVDRLDLTTDPEFNTELQPEGLVSRIKSMIGLGALAVELPPEQEAQRIRDAVISKLLEAVTVHNVPLSLVFQVTVETEDARKSALIADTIADLYILNQIEVKFEATEQATLWLSERVSALQSKLEEAEAKASEFSAATELVSVEALRALERQIKDFRDRIATAQVNRNAQASRIEALEAATTRAEQVEVSNDAQLERFLSHVENDPEIAEAFDTRFQIVLQRSRQDLARADQQLAALQASETVLSGQVSRQNEDLITLQQLTREAEATRVLYEYFLSRLNETSAQRGIQQADSRILSDAVVPNAPSAPRKSLILAMSAILGLMLSAGLILLREMRNNSFRTARELESTTGYTVLGQIPAMPAASRAKVLQYLSDKPTSAAAEAVRNPRTSLRLSNVDNPPKVVISTSSVPGEGKTTNSLALAQNLLGLGKRVLLVEGDIRRRTLHQYFKDMPDKGIVSVLSGELTLEEAVHRTSGFGADILGGEKSSINAADLFASDRFRALIEEARAAYDMVIIDTPPVLVVPDARIIADQADAIIFTVHWDKTSKTQVEESLRMFHNSGQRVTGLVLSQISPKGMKRYGYDGTYGAYSGYGAKYYTN